MVLNDSRNWETGLGSSSSSFKFVTDLSHSRRIKRFVFRDRLVSEASTLPWEGEARHSRVQQPRMSLLIEYSLVRDVQRDQDDGDSNTLCQLVQRVRVDGDVELCVRGPLGDPERSSHDDDLVHLAIVQLGPQVSDRGNVRTRAGDDDGDGLSLG